MDDGSSVVREKLALKMSPQSEILYQPFERSVTGSRFSRNEKKSCSKFFLFEQPAAGIQIQVLSSAAEVVRRRVFTV